MSVQTVTVTWTEQDVGSGGLNGSIRFALSGALDDAATGITYEPRPLSFAITNGTGQSTPIVANDDPALPAGSWYAITIAIASQPARTTYRYVNAALGATQALASLPLAVPAALAPAALPLPSGTPLAGYVPTVTTSGDPQTTWEPAGSGGGVTSVTAADGSVVIGGTGTSPAVRTGTLDVIATAHPPAAAVAMNAKKITGLANGTAATDAAAFGQIPVADATAADIQPDGTQTAGSIGRWADGGHIHPAIGWMPADNALLAAQGGDPALLTSTAITIAGTLYLIKLPIWYARTISSLVLLVSAAAAGTSTTTFCGLYSSAGALLTGSSDVGTPLKSAGPATLPVTTPQALTAGTFVWAALLTNFGTTQPTLFKGGSITNNVPNLGLAAAADRWAVNGTGLSALPASITPASNSIAGALTIWCGAT